MSKLSDISKVKPGVMYSVENYGVVTEVGRQYVSVRNNDGSEIQVERSVFENEYRCADQFEEVVKINQTELIKLVLAWPRAAMTVNYNTKPKAKEIAPELAGGQGDHSDKEWEKVIAGLIEGQERTMIGYHTGSLDERGRLRFNEQGTGLRLVDPRTLHWVIVNRTKYST